MQYVQASPTPTRKVMSAGLAAATTTIFLFVLKQYGAVELPAAVQNAILTVVTFLVAYYVPPAATDGVVENETS